MSIHAHLAGRIKEIRAWHRERNGIRNGMEASTGCEWSVTLVASILPTISSLPLAKAAAFA
jgi:hypothetical protein